MFLVILSYDATSFAANGLTTSESCPAFPASPSCSGKEAKKRPMLPIACVASIRPVSGEAVGLAVVELSKFRSFPKRASDRVVERRGSCPGEQQLVVRESLANPTLYNLRDRAP